MKNKDNRYKVMIFGFTCLAMLAAIATTVYCIHTMR